ncbi:MAG: UDP-N-acetylmuramate dehydrogenase [Clostridiales bacterium]|nr:UDP-N-acetylmuramate dehydrogenase [Clostridiales bacterium]
MNQYLKYKDLFIDIYSKDEIMINSLMKEHIYFKVGGPVDILLNPSKSEQIIKTIRICRENNIPYIVIGNGSNLLVKDGGIRGIVIKLCALNKLEINGDSIKAGAGVLLKDVSEFALENSLTGFEFACGIPGSVGGAVFMNAGAYDGEIKNVVKEIEVIDKEGNYKVLRGDEIKLGYRTSNIKDEKYIVISATFKLTPGDKGKIESRIKELTEKRESKQPLEYPSAGSTFKRPEGYFAGKLIEDSGLKGYQIGGAAVSEKHSGFIINKDNATAKDVLDLIKYVQKKVKSKFGVELTPEVRILGEDK